MGVDQKGIYAAFSQLGVIKLRRFPLEGFTHDVPETHT